MEEGGLEWTQALVVCSRKGDTGNLPQTVAANWNANKGWEGDMLRMDKDDREQGDHKQTAAVAGQVLSTVHWTQQHSKSWSL